jgi:hypothetical protein
MADGWYRTASGREVLLEQLHVQRFELGWLEGQAERIRERVLQELPDRARTLFPGTNGLLVKGLPPDHYPRYTFLAELHSFQPINPGADCSGLIVCWFGDRVPDNLDEAVAEALRDVAWEEHAADGWY